MPAVIKTKKLDVTKFTKKFTFPDEVGNVIFKNIGHQDIQIWFDNDKTEDSYSLDRGELTPVIKIQSNTIYFCVSDNAGRFSLLMWE